MYLFPDDNKCSQHLILVKPNSGSDTEVMRYVARQSSLGQHYGAHVADPERNLKVDDSKPCGHLADIHHVRGANNINVGNSPHGCNIMRYGNGWSSPGSALSLFKEDQSNRSPKAHFCLRIWTWKAHSAVLRSNSKRYVGQNRYQKVVGISVGIRLIGSDVCQRRGV